MSIKTGKQIGFFVALTMLLGSVVGIGIFFKNVSVLGAAHQNGTTALLAWIIGGLLSLAAALSFSEIGSLKTKNVHGLSAWAEITGGKKFGYFTRFNYSFFYFGILIAALGIFTAEAALMVLKSAGAISTFPHVGYIMLIGLLVSLVALSINLISIKFAGYIQTITTVLKFIPLLLALFIGLVLPNTHNAGGQNHFTVGDFTVSGLIAGLPAVLFAYDSFLNVGSLAGKTKGGEKTVSKVVILGMIAVVILYSLVAISAILHNGKIEDLLKDALPANAATGLSITIWTFIMISAYGVANGIFAAGVSNFEQSVKSNTFFGAKTLKAKWGEFRATIFYLAFTLIFWGLIVLLPAAIKNSDALIDGATNYPTLFFFAIYATVILLYFIKRSKYETKKMNSILFKTASIFAIVGIAFVIGWQLIWTQTIHTFLHTNEGISWGFVLDNVRFKEIEQFAVFASFLFAFAVLPYLNQWLTKKFENNNVIVNTQA